MNTIWVKKFVLLGKTVPRQKKPRPDKNQLEREEHHSVHKNSRISSRSSFSNSSMDFTSLRTSIISLNMSALQSCSSSNLWYSTSTLEFNTSSIVLFPARSMIPLKFDPVVVLTSFIARFSRFVKAVFLEFWIFFIKLKYLQMRILLM